tara:strand:- start:652 stop:846 length:195 start_codon:yes stop_codon:yes gene_type:complete
MTELWNAYIGSEWLPALTAAVTLASALCAVLASRSKSPLIQVILDGLSVLAINLNRSKMADDDR